MSRRLLATHPKSDFRLETARRSSLPDSSHHLTEAFHDPPAGPDRFPGIENAGCTSLPCAVQKAPIERCLDDCTAAQESSAGMSGSERLLTRTASR
jgi:hypothetical protein